MAVQYTEETIKALHEAFKAKDVDDSGTLDAEELEECLQLIGLVATEEDIEFITKHFDTNGDGLLQVEELMENIHIINTHVQHREDMMEAFKVFDTDGNGYIRLPEILKILTANNFMPVDEARKVLTELVRKYDRDGDGKFNYAEFVEIFAAKVLDPEKLEEHDQKMKEIQQQQRTVKKGKKKKKKKDN